MGGGSDPAFHPFGSQQVLLLDKAVFPLHRTFPDGVSRVLCLHNVSASAQQVERSSAGATGPAANWRDLISGETTRDRRISLPPYAVRWLTVELLFGGGSMPSPVGSSWNRSSTMPIMLLFT
jgi:hypothetical protein